MLKNNLNKVALDVSVNFKDFLRRLTINNEEILVQSPICKKILSTGVEMSSIMEQNVNEDQQDAVSMTSRIYSCGSPVPQHDGSLDSVSSGVPFSQGGWRTIGGGEGSSGGGAGSGAEAGRVAGLTMKEYDQHLGRLNKENFALKLRVYFLEEQQGLMGATTPDLYKANIEIKVENEALKRALYSKQQLLTEASAALTQLEEERRQHAQQTEAHTAQLQATIDTLHKSVDEYSERCQDLEAELLELQQQQQQQQQGIIPQHPSNLAELTQLCNLAFPTSPTPHSSAPNTADCWTNVDVSVNTGVPNVGSWSNAADESLKAPPSMWADAGKHEGLDDGSKGSSGSTESKINSGQGGSSAGSQLQRQFSTDSQSTSFTEGCNPVHVNTTNITNNNINNTLPNTSNNLQQMQYQHPEVPHQSQPHPQQPYQQPPPEHHYHHYQQPPPTGVVVVTIPQQQQQQQQQQQPIDTTSSLNVIPVGEKYQQYQQQQQYQQEQQYQQYAGVGGVTGMLPAPPMQGIISLRDGPTTSTVTSVNIVPTAAGTPSDIAMGADVRELEAQVARLTAALTKLRAELEYKQGATAALLGDVDNLKKELQDKETEVQEKDEKVESLMQDLETRHLQLQTKDSTIQHLHYDLDRVEPEISMKVQELVERDRIIEQKIEQIEQQNKILVEIQITLDEKQKQIAELEESLAEARERVTRLELDYDKSCGVIDTFLTDIASRDKEVASLKKEVRKRDRRVKDLVAELKETLDMLGKAQWEAEHGPEGRGTEDTVKEMVEEEAERLWAEVEQKKLELEKLRSDLNKAENRISSSNQQLITCQETISEKEEAEKKWQGELGSLSKEIENRETLLQENMNEVASLKSELGSVKTELEEKTNELCVAIKNGSGSDSDQQLKLEKLKRKLDVCKAEKAREIDVLKGQLDLKNNDILHLQSQLLADAKQGDSSKSGESRGACQTVVIEKCPETSRRSSVTEVSFQPVQVNITGLVAAAQPSVMPPTQSPVAVQISGKYFEASQPEISNIEAVHKFEKSEENKLDGEMGGKSMTQFQKQIEGLRQELRTTNDTIRNEMLEFGTRRNYQVIVWKYKREILNLRKRLHESGNSCELMRHRLEELADFMQKVLEMDERGLIDLSKISCKSKTSLYQTLNDSRALSQSLSESVLLMLDTTLEGGKTLDDGEDSLDMSCTAVSLISDDLQYLGEASSISCQNYVSTSLLDDTNNLNETNYQTLATKLYSQIDGKAKQIDMILVQITQISDCLEKREAEISLQSNVITELREDVIKLNEKLKVKETQLNALDRPPLTTNETKSVEVQCDFTQLVNVASQTLLAMAPIQSNIFSLPDLPTNYLTSCSESMSPASVYVVSSVADARKDENEEADNINLINSIQNENTETLVEQEEIPITNLLPQSTAGDENPTAVLLSLSADEKASKPATKTGCVSAGEVHPIPHHVPVSPSESEAWSEPDRNVSLARIGLETCTLAASLDRSLSRSRQTRASAAISSESETEECQVLAEDNAGILLSTPNPSTQLCANTKLTPKRKADSSEVRRIAAKLRTMEHLNDTLKAELNIYQSLSYQLSPTTDQQQSDHRVTSNRGLATHVNENHTDLGTIPATSTSTITNPTATITSTRPPSAPSSTSKKTRRFNSLGGDTLSLAAPLLQEIRSLRTKLEESISNNDQLRDQLEAAVLSCSRASDDPSHLTHLTAALLNAQETLQLTREKLAFAQRCEQLQSDRCALAERRNEDDARVCEALKIEFKDCEQRGTEAEQHRAEAEQRTLKAEQRCAEAEQRGVEAEMCWRQRTDERVTNEERVMEEEKRKAQQGEIRMQDAEIKIKDGEKRLQEARTIYEENEAALQERLAEVKRTCEDSEERLKDHHAAVNEMYASLKDESRWPHLSHLHSALQSSETQVLKVTRDRLVLLGEKSRLQAQLFSAQAQTSLLQDSLCEDEPSSSLLLHQRLAKVQAAVKNLQEHCAQLTSANAVLNNEKQRLRDELAGFKAVQKLVNKPHITLETVASPGTAVAVTTLLEAVVVRSPLNAASVRAPINVGASASVGTAEGVVKSPVDAISGEAAHFNNMAFIQLQKNYALLQEDYTHLQRLYNLLQDEEKETCQKLHISNNGLQKAQHNIDTLTQQCQENIQIVQREANEKILHAENQILEIQRRTHERIKLTEDKITKAEEQLKHDFSEDRGRLDLKLRDLLSQLDSERMVTTRLKEELNTIKQQQQQHRHQPTSHSDDSTAWSDNKENLQYNHSKTISSQMRLSNPILNKQSTQSLQNHNISHHSTYFTNNSNAPNTFGYLANHNTSNAATRRLSHRSLNRSDSYLLDTLHTEEETDEGAASSGPSPDLGLGSSDNGHPSSLERVMENAAITSGKYCSAYQCGTASLSRIHHSASASVGHINDIGSGRVDHISYLGHYHNSAVERLTERLSEEPLSDQQKKQQQHGGGGTFIEILCSVPSHSSLYATNERLGAEVSSLTEQLSSTGDRLADVLKQLATTTARKQSVERAICRQLSKTHHVLKKAKGNLQQQQQQQQGRHSSLN